MNKAVDRAVDRAVDKAVDKAVDRAVTPPRHLLYIIKQNKTKQN